MKLFAEVDVTLDLCALGKKPEFCAEVVSNGKRELLDFKAVSAKDFWVKIENLELLERFDDCRELKELTVDLLEERGGKLCVIKWKRSHLHIWKFWISYGAFQLIAKVDNFFCQ